MKNIFCFLAVIFTLGINSGCVRAQDGMGKLKNSTPEQRAAFQTKLMTEKLNLNTIQAKKVEDINLKYAEKFQPIIKSSGSRISKMKQAKALQAQKDTELQTVFTKDQFAQYQAFEQELKSKMMARMKED
jgi:hypothetical protein